MPIEIQEGWLSSAQKVPSPNFDERPASGLIDVLVIHNISLPPGQFGGGFIEAFFCNQLPWDKHPYFASIRDLQVSSHLLITREGQVVQFVAFDKRAWHAGKSNFEGRERCNDFSIGIELEGTDDIAYTEAQYQQLALVTKTLQAHYADIQPGNIVGHSHIAPGRKTDPGPAFDWAYYQGLIG